jgi:formate-dependent nitrite reductase membrane component NrfD
MCKNRLIISFAGMRLTPISACYGIKNIGTAADAAKALEPFAGTYAKDIFTTGVVGIGLLTIPVLAGSASYVYLKRLVGRRG